MGCIRWRAGVGNVVSRSLEDESTTAHTDFPSGRIEYFAWAPDGSLALVRGEAHSDVVLLTAPSG